MGWNIVPPDVQRIEDADLWLTIQGKAYFTTRYVDSLASGSSIDILVRIDISAPITYEPVGFVDIFSTGEAELLSYSNPTVTGEGTPMIVVNRRALSVSSLDVNVWHTPTVSAVGNLVYRTKWGSVLAGGGNTSKPVTIPPYPNYQFVRIFSRASGNSVNVDFNFYDHDGVTYGGV